MFLSKCSEMNGMKVCGLIQKNLLVLILSYILISKNI